MSFFVGDNISCSCWREKCDFSCPTYLRHQNSIQIMTNADRVRAMSDEELASVITIWHTDGYLSARNPNYSGIYESTRTLLEWLKSPVKEEE